MNADYPRFELRCGDYSLTILPECAYISKKNTSFCIDHNELLETLLKAWSEIKCV